MVKATISEKHESAPEQSVIKPAFEAGIFLVDKPIGPSSFRMVQLIRRALSIKKVGHAGTLDPFASGLLVICVGRPATKLISQFMDGDKVYEAVLQLGVETETQDPEGEIIARQEVPLLDEEALADCLASFQGEQLQVPPQYSALKHNGKPLYYYARRGIKIEKAARSVTISEIKLLAFTDDTVRFRVRCSKGTYIRTLASDIGKVLGCGAHLIELRRLASGCFSVAEAVDGAKLDDQEQALHELMPYALSVEEVLGRLAGMDESRKSS